LCQDFDKYYNAIYNSNIMDKDSLLNLIKNMRISLSVSQAEMAKRVGISTSFYGMIERGERTLSFEHFCQIANAFDITPIDLLMILERKD